MIPSSHYDGNFYLTKGQETDNVHTEKLLYESAEQETSKEAGGVRCLTNR